MKSSPKSNDPRSHLIPEHLRGQHAFRFLKMLYIIGLGLADERDISTKGLEIVRKAERVYLEAYTAILLVEKNALVGPNTPISSNRSSTDEFTCSRKHTMDAQ